MIELISGAIAYKADRWSGNEKKWLGYSFYALAILFPVLPFIASMGAYGLLFIPYAILCALALRKWGPWGELWPDDDNDPLDPKHKWFYRLVDKIYGHNYLTITGQSLKLWKILGWGVRYAIYGSPIILLYCLASLSITPLYVIPMAGIVRGVIYWYGDIWKTNAWRENWGGAISMMIIAASI